MSGQFCAYCKSSLRRGLVGAAFGSGTFWSLVRAQLVQFVVAQRRGRAGTRQPRQPRRQWRAVASRGEQGSKQCGAPDFFDGLGPWACQEAAGREKLRRILECLTTGRHSSVVVRRSLAARQRSRRPPTPAPRTGCTIIACTSHCISSRKQLRRQRLSDVDAW